MLTRTYLRNKRRRRNNDENENNGHFLVLSTAEAAILMISRQQEPRKQKVDRGDAKRWWTNGYANWSETEFKHRARINRNNFHFIYLFFFMHFFSQVRNIPERIILISTTGLR